MKTATPAKRLRALADRNGLSIEEYSPGLRVWTIRKKGQYQGEPLAFGVPHSSLADKIAELSVN